MTEKDQACLQANWFAFSFLMPEREFKEQWNKHSGICGLCQNTSESLDDMPLFVLEC